MGNVQLLLLYGKPGILIDDSKYPIATAQWYRCEVFFSLILRPVTASQQLRFLIVSVVLWFDGNAQWKMPHGCYSIMYGLYLFIQMPDDYYLIVAFPNRFKVLIWSPLTSSLLDLISCYYFQLMTSHETVFSLFDKWIFLLDYLMAIPSKASCLLNVLFDNAFIISSTNIFDPEIYLTISSLLLTSSLM